MANKGENEDGWVVKQVDMDDDLKQIVLETTMSYMDQCYSDQEIASRLKAKFDEEYEPSWQCIVGRHFGSVVTHELQNYIYFYVGQTAVMLFKSGK